jgi:hypothetical protein
VLPSKQQRGPHEVALATAPLEGIAADAQNPLRLWFAQYRTARPGASPQDVLAASVAARRDAYAWLFRATRDVQDRALSIELEGEAFQAIGGSWHDLGYPYRDVVPSLGTAIGSSGDRPEALAELVGILVNGGLQRPAVRFTELQFAPGTPYETILRPVTQRGVRVLSAAVASVARSALVDVVQSGTGRGIQGVLRTAAGTPAVVGGKTGTGDNEFKTFAPGGQLLDARVVNRTAAFVFFVGQRFFGVVSVYVPGPQAKDYQFTSALAVHVLRLMAPDVASVLKDDEGGTMREEQPPLEPEPRVLTEGPRAQEGL